MIQNQGWNLLVILTQSFVSVKKFLMTTKKLIRRFNNAIHHLQNLDIQWQSLTKLIIHLLLQVKHLSNLLIKVVLLKSHKDMLVHN